MILTFVLCTLYPRNGVFIKTFPEQDSAKPETGCILTYIMVVVGRTRARRETRRARGHHREDA